MATADKSLKISITVDGTEKVIADAGKVSESFAKIGTTVSSVNGELHAQAEALKKTGAEWLKFNKAAAGAGKRAGTPATPTDPATPPTGTPGRSPGPSPGMTVPREFMETMDKAIQTFKKAQKAAEEMADSHRALLRSIADAKSGTSSSPSVTPPGQGTPELEPTDAQASKDAAAKELEARKAIASTAGEILLKLTAIATETIRATNLAGNWKAGLEGAATGLNSMGAGLQAFGSTGNPVVGMLTAISTGLKDVFTADKALTNELNASEKSWENAVETRKRLDKVHADITRRIKQEGLINQFIEESRLLKEWVNLMNIIRGIKDVASDAKHEQRRVADDVAIRSGKPKEEIVTKNAIADSKEEAAGFDRETEDLRVKLKEATLAAEKARNAYDDAAKTMTDWDLNKEGGPLNAMRDADNAVRLIQQEIDALPVKLEQQKNRLKATLDGTSNEVEVAMEDQVKATAKKVIADVEAKAMTLADEEGKKPLPNTELAIKTLKTTLDDKTSDLVQGPIIQALINTISEDRSVVDDEMFKTLQKAKSAIDLLIIRNTTMQQDFDKMLKLLATSAEDAKRNMLKTQELEQMFKNVDQYRGR